MYNKICIWLCLLTFGCVSNDFEESFFRMPPSSWEVNIKKYTLEDQYRIFRFGNDVIHPPVLELAEPIAQQGETIVPFLLKKLKEDKEDIAVRDILQIFKSMNDGGYYKISAHHQIIHELEVSIQESQDTGWKDTCNRLLKKIIE